MPKLSTTGGTSDARFIKDYCPVIEFGLLSQQMHKIDEHVATADLVALTAIYRHILERYFRFDSLIPALRARSSHFAMSALTKAVNVRHSAVRRLRLGALLGKALLRLGRAEHRPTSALTLATISRGVPAGANSPNQPSDW